MSSQQKDKTVKYEVRSLYSSFICFSFHCSELKRRLKAEQKAKEKAEKEATKAATAPAAGGEGKKKSASAVEEEISPNEYFKLRSAAVTELKKSAETHPYPHKFHVSISLENYINKYNSLKDGEMLENEQLR